jgi:Fur family peroxide stress response transcriptional regulator
MLTRDSIIRALREKGLKVTPQRLAIGDVLVEREEAHPGADLIWREAKKRVKNLSLSTVYATLNELAKHGVIKLLQFDRMENRYECNIEKHVNLICEKCKEIMDYEIPVSIEPKEIAKKTGFEMTDMRLECYGLCEKCRKK